MPTPEQLALMAQRLGRTPSTAQGTVPIVQPKPPYGAIGMTPKGEPYYGPGIKGLVNKLFARFLDPESFKAEGLPYTYGTDKLDPTKLTQDETRAVKKQEWQDTTTEKVSNELAKLLGTPELTEEGKNLVRVGVGGIQNPLKMAKNQLGALWDTAIIAFTMGELPFRKGMAAHLGLVESYERETGKDISSIFTPSFVPVYTKLIGNVLKGNPMFSQRDRDLVDKNLRGSDMVYTMLFNEQKEHEYLRRAEAGENSDFLVEELANPWIELGGSLVFDLFNFIPNPGKLSKLKRVGSYADEMLPGLDNLEDFNLLKKSLEKIDDASIAGKLPGAFRSVKNGFFRVKDEIFKVANDYRVFTPTSSAKINFLFKRFNTVMESVLTSGDDIGETIQHVVRIFDPDEAVSNQAISMLLRSNSGSLFFSRSGRRTAVLINEIANELGGLDNLLKKVGSSTDPLDTYKLFDNAAQGALKKIYPSIDEMAAGAKKAKALTDSGKVADEATEGLAKAYKAVQKEHKFALAASKMENALGPVYKLFNSGLALMYFGASPGYVARNLMSDSIAMMFDEGMSVGAQNLMREIADGFLATGKKIGRKLGADDVKLLVERDVDLVKSIFDGIVPDAMLRGKGFHNAMDVIAGKTGRFGTMGMAEAVEMRESAFIYRYALTKYMRENLNKMLPEVDELVQSGVKKDLFTKILYDNYGDPKKIIKEYRRQAGTGISEVWRNKIMKQSLWDTLEFKGFNQQLRDIQQNAKTADEWEGMATNLGERYMDSVGGGLDDVKVASVDPDALLDHNTEVVGEAIKAGWFSADDTLFNVKRQSMQNLVSSSKSFIRKAFGDLIDNGFVVQNYQQEFMKLLEEDETFKLLANGFVDSVWKESKDLDQYAGKASSETLRAVWSDIVSRVKSPAGGDISDFGADEVLSIKAIRNKLWEFYRGEIGIHWNNYGEATAGEGYKILDRAVKELKVPKEISLNILHSDEWKKMQSAAVEFELWGRANSIKEGNVVAGDLLKAFTSQFESGALVKQTQANWKDFLESIGFEGGIPRVFRGVRKQIKQFISSDARQKIIKFGVDDLPIPVKSKVKEWAAYLAKDLGEGETPQYVMNLEKEIVGRTKSSRPMWLQQFEATNRTTSKSVGAALDKIVAGNGKDTGIMVERLKEEIISFLEYGYPERGIPPDLDTLKILGAPKKSIDDAIMDYKRLTGELPKGAKSVAENIPQATRTADDIAKEVVSKDDITVEQLEEYVLSKLSLSQPATLEAPMPTSVYLKKQASGFMKELHGFIDEVKGAWGQTENIISDAKTEKAITDWAKKAQQQFVEIRAMASSVAGHKRDFALHSYTDQTYLDQALNFIMPWHYWYSRAYPKYLLRAVENPRIVIAYKKYRDFLEQLHAGQSDWWKYQLSTSDFGIDLDNPLYFNIESTLNPMYGVTGVDFYDEKKRVNWYSRMVDDLSKFGPSLWTPINWMMAGALNIAGEKEAAKRWMGRLIPQSAVIKSTAFKLGVNIPGLKYNEIDPFVNIFYKGLDPYERNKIGRELGTWIDESLTDEERLTRAAQAEEAAYLQEGDVWNMGVQRSFARNAPGQMSSFLFGTGFKSRSKTDIEVDNFYTAYFNLLDAKDSMSSDQFSDSMVAMQKKYPFMDTVLLSRLNVEDRVTTYAYSVLSRIAPGQKNEMAELVGITPDLLSEFYDGKGDLTKMTPQDLERFKAGIADLGAIMAIPDDATQYEWLDASRAYKSMKAQMDEQFGDDISALLDQYYNMDNQLDRNKFTAVHPAVGEALDFQTKMIAGTPMLYKYYGGIQKLESYYRTEMYDILKEKYGSDIVEIVNEYYDLKVTDAAGAKSFYKSHPEISAYFDMKDVLQNKINQIVVKLADKLPERPAIAVRSDFEPKGATQNQLAEGVAAQSEKTWEEWSTQLTEPVQRIIIQYFQTGEPLSSAVNSELDYLASIYGYKSGDALLQTLGLALSK
jgi:hypothetical protein